jgi:2-polyprenyl-3-methyl-5-hydroxy-6-metoxy-1,4-benzoquinol methylase
MSDTVEMGMPEMSENRSERERRAYDEKNVGAINAWWHGVFRHVYECPNTARHFDLFDRFLTTYGKGSRILDIGCGAGDIAERLLTADAAYVFGIDVSETQIEEARNKAVRGRLEFSLMDVSSEIQGDFDLIFGRSILHHVDYRPILQRLYHANLNRGGAMVFLEPLGSNILIKLYHLISKAGHTPDERPLTRADLAWLWAHFERCEVIPANLLSFIIGVPSSFLSLKPTNLALRVADTVDTWIAAKLPFLTPYFRAAIIVITKPRG